MKAIFSLVLFLACSLCLLICHADTSPAQAMADAAVNGAVNGALQAAQQQLNPGQLMTTPIVATIGALVGAFGLILSGFQQLFGLGAKSKNAKLASVSAKALTAIQHVAGAPDVPTPPKSS